MPAILLWIEVVGEILLWHMSSKPFLANVWLSDPKSTMYLHPAGAGIFDQTGYSTFPLFQFRQRGVVNVIFCSGGFGDARLIHFLLDARECRLVGFLLRLVFIHTCTMSRVHRDRRSIWDRADSLRIVSWSAVLHSPY
jgi:hypothetical protein